MSDGITKVTGLWLLFPVVITTFCIIRHFTKRED